MITHYYNQIHKNASTTGFLIWKDIAVFILTVISLYVGGATLVLLAG